VAVGARIRSPQGRATRRDESRQFSEKKPNRAWKGISHSLVVNVKRRLKIARASVYRVAG
jgi:hypothetical protein